MITFSEALEAAPRYAVKQLHGKGYYRFTPAGVEADALFGAYLGRYGPRGLKRVTEALDTTAACTEIQRGLMRAWPDLGRAVNSAERKKLSGGNIEPPKRGETWIGYVSRLNDSYLAPWDSIAGIAKVVGL